MPSNKARVNTHVPKFDLKQYIYRVNAGSTLSFLIFCRFLEQAHHEEEEVVQGRFNAISTDLSFQDRLHGVRQRVNNWVKHNRSTSD